LKVAPEFIVKEAAKVAFPEGAVKTAPELRLKAEFISKVVNDDTSQVPATTTEALEEMLVIAPVLPPLKVRPASVAVEKPESEEPEFIVITAVELRVPVPDKVPFNTSPTVVKVGLFPRGKEQSELIVFAFVVKLNTTRLNALFPQEIVPPFMPLKVMVPLL
jgi:hypothetical protein